MTESTEFQGQYQTQSGHPPATRLLVAPGKPLPPRQLKSTTMKKRRLTLLASGVLLPLAALATYAAVTRINPNPEHAVGEQLDELNGVAIYYNGGVNRCKAVT